MLVLVSSVSLEQDQGPGQDQFPGQARSACAVCAASSLVWVEGWGLECDGTQAHGTLYRHGAQSDGREEEKLCKYRKEEWNLPPRYMQIFVQNWHFERARRGSFTFLAFPPLHWSLFTLFTSSNTSITLKHLTEHAEAV